MTLGTIVDGRFVAERLAGAGGMGEVYCARDRATGDRVALKVMTGAGPLVERFAQEVEVLRSLSHPGVVGYRAHGTTAEGRPYLAMEWLDGEDLAARLSRRGLDIAETVLLGERVASALAFAHARGVVHRDIKPQNLFLVGGEIGRVKVLDFGVARLRTSKGLKTQTGLLVGTPGYLAPEQARGAKDVDARADVFSLGCVLYECLTGAPPFAAEHLMAVLAKILLEEAPRVSSRVPSIAPALDDLLARMLAKDPAARPLDGAALLAEIAALGELSPVALPASIRRPEALTRRELRLVSVVLVGAPPDPDRPEVAARTLSAAEVAEPTLGQLRARVAPFGAAIEPLADGSVVVLLSGTRAATDQVAQAARAALSIRAVLPDVPMALATGRAMVDERWPVGEVIDRAAFLLRLPRGDAAARSLRPIRIDQITAGLLDARFDVGGDGASLGLRGEREIVEAGRTLLGRPTPCVGRAFEQSSLEAHVRRAIDEPAATAVVITGAAGVGKSRLRDELIRRVQQSDGDAAIWIARGDPVQRSAPFGLVGPLLRTGAAILDGEPLELQRQKIEARVARHVPEPERARVGEFLGELLGVPFPDDGRVQLRAARAEPALMADQIKRAFVDFFAAEVEAAPLLIVLDDLHWGDLPSVKLIDAALRRLADRPMMVLGIGRPELSEVFPDLWADHGVEQMRLGPLKQKGVASLVRAALGPGCSEATIERIWERSAGNAFYLEELIRAVAEGRGDDLPPTVLAMVQARLEGLPPEARRILRAASVFGMVFWRGAVTALLGGDETFGAVSGWLSFLVEREILVLRGEGRFPGEIEHAFRHSTVRDAAYSMLTEDDRRLGHTLAGAWLASAGEPSAALLAEHFERGGEPLRAIGGYHRAAERALEGNDFGAAIDLVERAVRCGASGETLGALRAIQAEAQGWGGDYAAAERSAAAALGALPHASERWLAAAAEAAVAHAKLGKVDALVAAAQQIQAIVSAGRAGRPALVTAARATIPLLLLGRHAEGEALLAALEAQAGLLAARDPALRARILYARAIRAAVKGNPGALIEPMEAAAQSYDEAGDLRNAAMQRVNVGFGLLELGDYDRAEQALRSALAAAERLGLSTVAATAKHDLGLVLGRRGQLAEGLAIEADAALAFQAHKDMRMEGASRNYLALLRLAAGDPSAAEREALAAISLLAGSAPMRAHALAALAEARLRTGRGDEALAASDEAMTLLTTLGGIDEGESYLRLVHAEALHAAGRIPEARAAIGVARDKLLARAARIEDPARSATFLSAVPENARTLRLAGVLDALAQGGPA
jgi:tetratricopeptide (TPR) repeat protein